MLFPQIEAGKCRPFLISGFGPIDWNRDFAPWYLEGTGIMISILQLGEDYYKDTNFSNLTTGEWKNLCFKEACGGIKACCLSG